MQGRSEDVSFFDVIPGDSKAPKLSPEVAVQLKRMVCNPEPKQNIAALSSTIKENAEPEITLFASERHSSPSQIVPGRQAQVAPVSTPTLTYIRKRMTFVKCEACPLYRRVVNDFNNLHFTHYTSWKTVIALRISMQRESLVARLKLESNLMVPNFACMV